MFNLPGPPGVGNKHGQHETVLTSTTGEPLQGDPGGGTQYPEADRRIKMASGIWVALVHGYFLTR